MRTRSAIVALEVAILAVKVAVAARFGSRGLAVAVAAVGAVVIAWSATAPTRAAGAPPTG